jgi:hypothetical protein
MGIRRPIKPRSWLWLCNGHASRLRVAALVTIAALLPACSATQFADLPSAIGGETRETPRAPANPPVYPAVHDMPPPRQVPVMTDDQQRQAEAELVAARDRQVSPASKKPATQQAQKKQQTAAKQAPAKPAPAERTQPDETNQ